MGTFTSDATCEAKSSLRMGWQEGKMQDMTAAEEGALLTPRPVAGQPGPLYLLAGLFSPHHLSH